jgi:hypothetical protein
MQDGRWILIRGHRYTLTYVFHFTYLIFHKVTMRLLLRIVGFSLPVLAALLACAENPGLPEPAGTTLSDEQKAYWYNGEAELTSFRLSQARYGELRAGTAVMIFVTEDFNTENFTKTENRNENVTSVMKLNFTRNFTTGIYPYSIMTSSFLPFEGNEHALKVSASIQEWCGHVYMEVLRKRKYELSVFSYFEDESIKNEQHEITWLEDELWSLIRINPSLLPTGNQQVVPSFAWSRLMHVDLKAYACEIKLTEGDTIRNLQLYYPDLERKLIIQFNAAFPHEILKWEEEYRDGFGSAGQMLVTTGERITTIKSAYWKKNKTIDEPLRKELGLE